MHLKGLSRVGGQGVQFMVLWSGKPFTSLDFLWGTNLPGMEKSRDSLGSFMAFSRESHESKC